MKKISHPQKVCSIRWAVGKSSGSSRWSSMAKPASLPHHRKHYRMRQVCTQTYGYCCCTLPVTSCSSERSFSTLKRIKTYLRSTCGNERLTSLALMHIHRDVPVSSQEMVDKFARLHPRRLKRCHSIMAQTTMAHASMASPLCRRSGLAHSGMARSSTAQFRCGAVSV